MKLRYEFNHMIPYNCLRRYIGRPIVKIYDDEMAPVCQTVSAGILMDAKCGSGDATVKWLMPLQMGEEKYSLKTISRLTHPLGWDKPYIFFGGNKYRTLTQEEYKRYKAYVLGRQFTW